MHASQASRMGASMGKLNLAELAEKRGGATTDALAEDVRLCYGKFGWSFVKLKGKVPVEKGWNTRPPAPLEEVLGWIADGWNVGVRTGKIPGTDWYLVVIDVDSGGDHLPLNLPPTLSAYTGGDGRHMYFLSKLPIGNSSKNLGHKIDVRGEGGQVVAVGSTHASGKQYEWEPGYGPNEIEMAELPIELATRLTKSEPRPAPKPTTRSRATGGGYAATALKLELDAVARASEGTRNDTLVRSAFSLGQLIGGGALDRVRVEADLLSAAVSAGLPRTEALKTIKSGIDAGIQQPRSVPERATTRGQPSRDGASSKTGPKKKPRKRRKASTRHLDVSHNVHALNDMYNAELFVEDHGEDVHYVEAWRAWLVWTGRRWERDERGNIYRRVKQTVRRLNNIAAGIDNDTIYQAYMKFIKQSGQAQRMAGMLKCAQGEEGVSVMASDFDADPYLFNCLNGTLDLRTGTLREHRREDLITKLAPVEYDPGARSDLFDDCLFDAMGGDLELMSFLCRAAGSALVAGNPDEKLFFLYGPAATGKSTFLDAVQGAMGDYGKTADFNSFLRTREPRSHQAGLAHLVGARFVSSCEVEDGKRLAEGVLNTMAGGDRITIRNVYEKAYEIKPSWKLFLAANVKPRLTDDEKNGIWRRILLVPFDVEIPEDKRDPAVKRTLSNPAVAGAAVLAWLVKGCLDWQKNRLQVPERINAATTAYREEQDPLRDFLADCCTSVTGADGKPVKTPASALWEAYCKYSGKAGMTQTAFGRRMGAKYERKRTATGHKAYVGVALLANTDDNYSGT